MKTVLPRLLTAMRSARHDFSPSFVATYFINRCPFHQKVTFTVKVGPKKLTAMHLNSLSKATAEKAASLRKAHGLSQRHMTNGTPKTNQQVNGDRRIVL